MYGFPTQTVQETVDALEMVRQMFATGVLQSAFWHLFTMTAHSPVGLDPVSFKVKKRTDQVGTFANNDIEHVDPTGANHEIFGFGLKKALFNYMHGVCFDWPLQKWFDFPIPAVTVPKDYIQKLIEDPEIETRTAFKVLFIGSLPYKTIIQKSKKGAKWEEMQLHFIGAQKEIKIMVEPTKGEWLFNLLVALKSEHNNGLSYNEIKSSYKEAGLEGFELFWDNKPVTTLHKVGLLKV
jgi:hypothetical protein